LVFIGYLISVHIIDPAGIENRYDIGLIKDEGLYNL
jgi:hypothetical protein